MTWAEHVARVGEERCIQCFDEDLEITKELNGILVYVIVKHNFILGGVTILRHSYMFRPS
jgi:hypothetical protein